MPNCQALTSAVGGWDRGRALVWPCSARAIATAAAAAWDILQHMGKVNRWGWFPWDGANMPQIEAGMFFRDAAFTLVSMTGACCGSVTNTGLAPNAMSKARASVAPPTGPSCSGLCHGRISIPVAMTTTSPLPTRSASPRAARYVSGLSCLARAA